MKLHGCLRVLKYVVFLMNLVLWLVGMLWIGLAVYVLIDPHTNHYIHVSFSTQLHHYQLLCYVLIAAGAVMTFVGFLGCCGAFQESRCMVGTFTVCALVTFSLVTGGSVWAFVQRGEIEEAVSTGMMDYVLHNYTSHDEQSRQSVDHVQQQLSCCGVSGPGDWVNSSWAEPLTPPVYPASCCPPPDPLQPLCTSPDQLATLSQQGCGERLSDVYTEKWTVVCLLGFTIAVLQLLTVCFSLALFCGMRRQAGGGYKA